MNSNKTEIQSEQQREQIEKQIALYEQQESTQKVSVPFGDSTLELEVDAYVANPDIMNSGIQVVQYLVENPELVKGRVVTDMGTGCGIIGIAAALLGARRVYMPEIDDKAVENARRNIALHGLENICDAFQSDLFSAYGDREKSEVQIFNHPFFSGEPVKGKGWTQMMLGGSELIGKYFAKAPLYSTRNATYILPWLTLAGNEDKLDNDPGKRGPEHGYKVIKEIKQDPVKIGLQQAQFKIYELGYVV